MSELAFSCRYLLLQALRCPWINKHVTRPHYLQSTVPLSMFL